MNTRTARTRLVLVLALLVFATFAATSSALACVVGRDPTTGTCTEAALDACLPGGGRFDGTVTFNCGGAATITVTSTKIISANTRIDGGGVITISGGGTVGVFVVNLACSLNSLCLTFTVENLTIANGHASTDGGAINNNCGTLNVTNSTFSGNVAAGFGGAIVTTNMATVTNSTFSGNSSAGGGGAIYVGSGLTVTNSTFSDNSAPVGGAILQDIGATTVANSTFSGNSTPSSGGGGAISNAGGTVTVTNSTFSGNSAGFGGALINAAPPPPPPPNPPLPTQITVTNSTFSGNSATNGAAIFDSGMFTVTVVNSILANSTSGGNCSGAITDGGHNIDDGTTCGFTGTGCGGYCVGGNRPGQRCLADSDCTGTPPTPNGTCTTTNGTSFCNTNPLLDLTGLASNGGPTQTIALVSGSPAINHGDESVCMMPPVNNLDQRGFVRPGMSAANCSIGAYEASAVASAATTTSTTNTCHTTTSTTTTTTPPTTTSTSTTTRPTTTSTSTSTSATTSTTSPTFACVVGTGTSASCTEAALDACLPGGGSFNGTVTFNCGGAATVTVTSTKTISADTTIDGGGVITISGGGTVQVFAVNSSVTFTVQNLTIANGFSRRGGAIVNAGGTVTVTNNTFSGNSASDSGLGFGGGAIFNVSGTLTVTNSTFSGNSAPNSFGGAIYNDSGTLTVTNSTFSGNSVVEGGAIFNLGTLTVTNSTFSGNSAHDGGAIENGGTLTVTNSTFSGNSAALAEGGAITTTGTATVSNSTFSGNSAALGGAIFNEFGTLTVTDSTFSRNSAPNPAGTILNYGGMLTVANCTFSGNTAAGGGGAIFNEVGGILTVTNSTFSGNSASGGGAIFNGFNGGTLTVTNSIVANSTSGGNCGVSSGGTITDGGHNIDDGTTCGFTGAGCATPTGTSFCNTNPQLDLAGLASNGGPTQTIALEAGSPAINAGDETVCAAPPVNNLDQRGFVRPGMGATNCSIGAYEFDAAPSATTTTTTSPPTTTTTTTSFPTTTSTSTSPTTSTTATTTTSTIASSSTTSTPSSTTTTTQPPIQCCVQSSPMGAFNTCTLVTATQCATQNGVNVGPGTCSPNPCPPPIAVVVTSPTAGTVTITVTSTLPPPPPGFELLTFAVQISAPAGTAANPLVLMFTLEASIIPAGQNANTIAVLKNGVMVPDCPGSSTASPDPCVSQRTALAAGAVGLTVLTSTASQWAFAVPVATTTTMSSTTSTTSSTASTTQSTTTTTSSTSTTRSTTTTTTIPGNLPPDCSGAAATPSMLWPPNHQFVTVSVVGVRDPDGDSVAITITGITQDEPLNGGGSGNTCSDATGVGTATASLRAEREGTGDGRVYHINFAADDGRGGRCTGTVTVCVPHDQGHGRMCVDQGPLVDSTGPTCVGACTAACAIEMAVAQPVCTGENLPAALVQRLNAAQQLISQAAGTTGKKKAKRLMRRGIKALKQAAGIATKDAKKGTVSSDCAKSVAMEFGNAKAGADRWLHTR